MGILGKGTAHGACSLLHAAGLQMGASLALDLPVTVRLRDNPPKNEVEDPDELLPAVINAWQEFGHSLPKGDLHWMVNSKVPQRQGLKSSAAIAVAAIRALADATDTELEITQIIDMAVMAQRTSGVSITGSADDAWATATEGWKLVDPNVPAAEGVLLEGTGPISEEWYVLILLREERKERPDADSFAWHQQGFQQALNALQDGNELVCLTWNGRAMAGVLNDHIGRRLTNDAFVNGGRAAGITGSGNAIVIFTPSVSEPIYNRIKGWYESRAKDCELIETKVLNPPPVEESDNNE
ncbi:MAG TPA: hypothetical protein EYQ53_05270 [Candidatus Poseidoniales archaeon]|nr:MAG: hypothetical protein CXT69_02170 [Euryarchaeota archaeon]HIG03773.1 hypothetical protein [Candidatus Poseidoniales archaeon]HIK78708.1 hypothetical protein [Candidatus Poseidoniales archaeon]